MNCSLFLEFLQSLKGEQNMENKIFRKRDSVVLSLSNFKDKFLNTYREESQEELKVKRGQKTDLFLRKMASARLRKGLGSQWG